MAGKATQSKQAADVIGGKTTPDQPAGSLVAGALFGAVSALAAVLAPDIELAPKDESETEADLSIRLLGELVERGKVVLIECEELKGSLAVQKGLVTKAENAHAADRDNLRKVLVGLKLVTEGEAGAENFDPVAAAAGALGDVVAERNSAKRSLAAQKGATTRKVAELEQLEASLEPRKLGKVADQLSGADLFDLLGSEDRVEIAFSDGAAELVGVPPVAVPGERFIFRRGRLMLSVEDLTVRGPADERGARVLAGYALLVDGEQVAWLPRLAGQLTLGAGQSYQLKDDVVLA